MPPPNQVDWRPRPTGDTGRDVNDKRTWDSIYGLRDQISKQTQQTQKDLGTISQTLKGLSLKLQTKTIQYTDWGGNHQSITVVTGVTLEGQP